MYWTDLLHKRLTFLFN